MNPVVPLLDLRAQFATIREEINEAIARVVESQQFILGPELDALEREVAEYCQARHAVGCASGTDALVLALMALGVGAGDEVITTPYTFFATAGVIARLGARPVFVDIDPGTYNIDPAAISDRLTPRTKAIIPVHLFGQTAEMGPIQRLANRHGLPIIEDACQAIGADYHGRRTGVLGRVAAFSFFPSKNLGGFGDGGMISTDEDELAEKLRILRVHGMEPKYYHRLVGINGRLDALQAAVLRVKLRRLENWTTARQVNARRYAQLLEEREVVGWLTRPAEQPGFRHVFNQYVIRVPAGHRDPLRKQLVEQGVGTEVYYPVPLHLQECFAGLGYRRGDFPHAEQAAAETIALPVYPELTEAQQAHVVESIAKYVSKVTRTALAA
ncbi:MAG: DegT/DnrJ/EryC1/StrS family aminotransferase [Planctomycetes bacterium]|nr:DegT/DnrJ/EryC1/StrS family aminotransferase [Planctomycetota bacterium]